MMHIIVYQDYTENTEYIVLQTIIANKVSINTAMKQDGIKAINHLKRYRCYKYFKIQLMYPELNLPLLEISLLPLTLSHFQY